MVAGTWLNQDGLVLQFGSQKVVPETGGDYLVYGETREIEQLIPLVPMQIGTGGQLIAAPPTTFVGTGTAAQAGITSLTQMFPLQQTVPNVTTSGGNLVIVNPQLFIESVEVETLVGATGGTSLTIGLATVSPGSPSSTFVQVTPNAGVQLVNGILTANMTSPGQKVTYTQTGATAGFLWSTPGTGVAGGGSWLGNVPLVTNAITPLPQSAYISTIATGAFTNGLIKVRIRYNMYGSINQ